MAFKMKGPGSCMGTGTTGFNDKSGVLMKAPSMAPMMGTMTEPGGINFNAGLRKASADGKLNANFGALVDAHTEKSNAPTAMNQVPDGPGSQEEAMGPYMREMAYKKEY